MNGIIKLYNPRRGYGFIQPLIGKPDTTPDVFFHITGMRDKSLGPFDGAEVRFEVVRAEKGPIAVNIEMLRLGGHELVSSTTVPRKVEAKA